MKKIFGLCVALATSATMFMSCNSSASAKVVTANDTLNYAFGAANGSGIRNYVLGDTATDAQVAQFCEAFNEAFNADRTKALQFEGLRMGGSMYNEVKDGFLFGDSTITYNEKVLMGVFNDAINGNYFMDPQEAMNRFQELMGSSMQTGGNANLPAEQVDSLNMFFALINGQGARRFILDIDTTNKDIKSFMKGINQGLEGNEDNKAYMDGIQVATTLKQQLKQMNGSLFNDSTLAVNEDIIVRGLMDALRQEPNAIMNGEDAQAYIQSFFEARQANANKELAAEGEAFLAENATKEGVMVTESGLQYKVVTMGNGEKPTADDKVKVHYHGTLIDGTVFDSSVERGEPIEFPLNGVIKGWTEGLQLMPVGSKFILYIPYQLAYGERGAGENIGPCEALIFEVELLEIVK